MAHGQEQPLQAKLKNFCPTSPTSGVLAAGNAKVQLYEVPGNRAASIGFPEGVQLFDNLQLQTVS